MSRHDASRNVLALIGAAFLLVSSAGWVARRAAPEAIVGYVRETDGRRIRGLSVFLDRGTNLVERYVTDSAGMFTLPLFAHEPHRAVWLICVPGALPIVGRPARDEFTRGGTTVHSYDYTPALDSVWRAYRTSGWSGPIPRECPRGVDSAGWRYPASTGKHWGTYTTVEPDWARFPGPPELPND
jgi:hypothetical protein